MAAISVQVPFPVFYDRDGQPLDNGNIYIGTANTDALTNQIQVYYDEALTITASQPLKTSNGYIYRNGTPAQVYVNANDFSISVRENNNVLVYNFATATGLGVGAATISYDPPFTGAVTSNYTVSDKLSQTVSVKDFGAVGDGVTDDTAAIQAAFDTGENIYLPLGEYYITDKVSMNPGQMMHGDGRTVSRFLIKPDFNLSATGVLSMGGAEPGAEIYDVGFYFTQADQSVRANCTQYPPAIDAIATPRFIVDRVRINAGWDGINATGNSGGSYIGFVEIGTLNKGIQIDGSLDFFHGKTWHLWPFGIAGTVDLIDVYYDGDTIGTEVGRCDGFAVDELAAFSSQVIFTANATYQIPMEINTLQLDNDGGRLLVQGGHVVVSKSYSTKTNAATEPTVHVTNDASCILSCHSIATNATGYELYCQSGKLAVNGGTFVFVNLNAQLCRVDAGQMSLNNIFFNAAPNVAYTQPHVVQAGGLLSVNNCEWAGCGTGTGFAVFYISDQTGNRTANNSFGGWQYSYPVGSNFAGVYAPNNNAATPLIFNNLSAPVKYRYLNGTSDALGDFSIAHGVTNAQLKVLSASAWYKGASGEAIPAVIDAIDGTTIFVSGAGNTDEMRVVIQWTNYDDATW